MNRSDLLHALASRIDQISLPHPIRVAIDGVDAAGKTTLAQELVPIVQRRGRQVIRASIDDFLNPERIRYRRGNNSPEGYYQDSFNYQSLIAVLLKPLGPDGSLEYCSAIFDHLTDSEKEVRLKTAEANAVLLLDGVFLLRPELREHWDFAIFVEAAFEVTLARAMQRDFFRFSRPEDVKKRYQERYIPGQRLYLEECQPTSRADVVVDNNDPTNPFVLMVDETSDNRCRSRGPNPPDAGSFCDATGQPLTYDE